MFKPKFTITSDINNRIAEIERFRTRFEHATILPEQEIQLRLRATVESIYSSTSIEGNPLRQSEVEKTLKGQPTSAPDYAITEVLNYKKALDWVNQQEKKHDLTSKDVLKLHEILMDGLLPPEKVGNWRKGSVYVVDEVNGKEIVQYEGPNASDVPQLVKSFLKWISLQQKTSFHPILIAGLIHYIFVSIHPFADGNGRCTRLITSYYLRKMQYDFQGSLSLDSFYLINRDEYFNKLSLSNYFEGRMEVDLTPFLDFFTKGFLESVNDLYQYIQLNIKSTKQQKPIRLNADEMAILDYVNRFGSIDLKEAEEVLNKPRRTVQRRLAKLVDLGILKMDDLGPATKYTLG